MNNFQATFQWMREYIKAFWKLILAAWILKIIIIFVILSYAANAISFNAFGYKVSWNEQQIVDEVGDMETSITNEFDEEIKFINSFKESQMFFKELDYKRIGIIDTSTGMAYTAIIEDGIILHIEEGLNEPEAVIKANIAKISDAVSRNNFIELKNHIQIPFKVKLRIILTRWF